MDNLDSLTEKIEMELQKQHSTVLFLLFHKIRMVKWNNFLLSDAMTGKILDECFSHQDIWESTYEWLEKTNWGKLPEYAEMQEQIRAFIAKWAENTPVIWRDTQLIYDKPTTRDFE